MTALLPWSAFAAMLAAAGLPIYLHAPKAYAEANGIGIGALGATLGALRLVDVVQDPALGWLAEVTRRHRAAWVAGATLLMAGAMLALLALPPPMAPLVWFALTLTLLFSAWSYLSIVFYAQGVSRAATLGPQGHLRLAGWRETGSLLGVMAAAIAPVVLAPFTPQPLALFAMAFALLALLGTVMMRREWTAAPTPRGAFRPLLADPALRRLLLLALVNSTPVAITSTLFLYFVESRLQLPGWEGPLLLAFFAAAAISAPFWTRAATRHGPRRTLAAGMALSIAAFLFALTLGPGDLTAFALISAASGAALGADMVLLPALFAARLQAIGQGEAAGFSLWSLITKAPLAIAVATVLPALAASGFTGPDSPASALTLLTLLYAALPCALKAVALALLLLDRR